MGIISAVYNFLWGDLFTIPIGGGIGISLLVALLIPTGLYFTVRTRLLPVRCFPEMLRVMIHRESGGKSGAISGLQALIVSTATRVGMGNMVGVVAAISAGGPGAVFWMWVTALIGASTAFVEATLAQLYKENDPLFGGYRGGPAYYIHAFFSRGKKKSVLAVAFALSGLLCWCGVSQVISNSVSASFQNAFSIPPMVSTVVLVALAAVVVLRKNASVKVLDVIVPIMAGFYFLLAIFVIVKNAALLPGVFARIVEEAFGLRQAAAGAFGGALMNGVKRGLFSNEAGMGSTPHAHAQANVAHPHDQGVVAMAGVFIDTFVVLTLNALVIISTLYTTGGPLHECGAAAASTVLNKTNLAQTAFGTVFGESFGNIFVAICLFFFAFSTVLGWNLFGRINANYLFGKKNPKLCNTIYTLVALVFIFLGTLTGNDLVWELTDMFNNLIVLPNALALFALTGMVCTMLKEGRKNKLKL